eukprot:4611503-Lingulodinium_polyedra.AAC.1
MRLHSAHGHRSALVCGLEPTQNSSAEMKRLKGYRQSLGWGCRWWQRAKRPGAREGLGYAARRAAASRRFRQCVCVW